MHTHITGSLKQFEFIHRTDPEKLTITVYAINKEVARHRVRYPKGDSAQSYHCQEKVVTSKL